MKNLILLFLSCLLISSCSVFYGPNYDNRKKVQNLEIGMTKQQAINIMGNEYILESTSQEEDGILEILKFYSTTDVPYLLHFINGKLILFNRYYPPYTPQETVIIKHEKE